MGKTLIKDNTLGYDIFFFTGFPLTDDMIQRICANLGKEVLEEIRELTHRTVTWADPYSQPDRFSDDVLRAAQPFAAGYAFPSKLPDNLRAKLREVCHEYTLICKYLKKQMMPLPGYTLGCDSIGPFHLHSINRSILDALMGTHLDEEFIRTSEHFLDEIRDKGQSMFTVTDPLCRCEYFFLKLEYLPVKTKNRLLSRISCEMENNSGWGPERPGKMSELLLAEYMLKTNNALMLVPSVRPEMVGPKHMDQDFWSKDLDVDLAKIYSAFQTKLSEQLTHKKQSFHPVSCEPKKTTTPVQTELYYGQVYTEYSSALGTTFFLHLKDLQEPINKDVIVSTPGTKDFALPCYVNVMNAMQSLYFDGRPLTADLIKAHRLVIQQLIEHQAIALNPPLVNLNEWEEKVLSHLTPMDHHNVKAFPMKAFLQEWNEKSKPAKLFFSTELRTWLGCGDLVRIDVSKLSKDFKFAPSDSLIRHLINTNQLTGQVFAVKDVDTDTCELNRFLSGIDFPKEYLVLI